MTSDSMSVGSGDTSHPMEFLLTEEFALQPPMAGEIRQGCIVERRNNELLVDIGAKSEGIISSQELESIDADTRKKLVVGSEVPVYVVNPEDKNGNIILSYKKAAEEQDWVTASELLEKQESFQSKIIGYNRGGALVQVGQIRGFIPNSQLCRNRSFNTDGNPTGENSGKPVGETVHVKVIEVDRKRNRLILSERAADKEFREAKRADFLAKIEEGDIYEGQVVNLTDYGAFVDIGGIEGLVHLSELSWKRVNNPTDVVKLGESVRVQVLTVDEERQRIALSIKRLQPDPWSFLEEQYRIGQLVEASITKLTKFGAFARLNDELELQGLIHISELSEDHVNHPREVVKPSDDVTVRIIRIDPEQRQLGLSLKQVTSDKFLEMDWEMMDVDAEVAADDKDGNASHPDET